MLCSMGGIFHPSHHLLNVLLQIVNKLGLSNKEKCEGTPSFYCCPSTCGSFCNDIGTRPRISFWDLENNPDLSKYTVLGDSLHALRQVAGTASLWGPCKT
jgi:hypothetical protein